MIVIPESQYEEKQRQIVIWPFEVCEYGKCDDRDEEFVNVFQHVEFEWTSLDFKYSENLIINLTNFILIDFKGKALWFVLYSMNSFKMVKNKTKVKNKAK